MKNKLFKLGAIHKKKKKLIYPTHLYNSNTSSILKKSLLVHQTKESKSL